MNFSFTLLHSVITSLAFGHHQSVSKVKTGLAAMTTTVTHSYPKITRTVKETITAYGSRISRIPKISTSTNAHPPADPSNTTILSPLTIHTNPNIHKTSKIIGILFAIGAVLVICFVSLLVLCYRRYKKIQQKRVTDWIEVSALHDRHSTVGNCGTPAAEQVIFRRLENGEVIYSEGLQVPQKAMLRSTKNFGMDCITD